MSERHRGSPSRGRAGLVMAGMAGAAGMVLMGPAGVVPAHAAASCSPAGTSGFTAAMVATAGQSISGQTIDATGCDLGIYIGPSATNVTVDGVTISGANDHAIYAQDTTGVTIKNSTIQNNGVKPTAGVTENKAVELDGSTNSSVTNNTVQNNVADGAIGVDDDGPLSPGAPAPGPKQPVNASNITVSGNKAPNNYGGCTIVVAAYDAGSVVDHITVTGNTVSGTPGQFGPNGPVIGQIVVANDGPGNRITNTTVSGNTITGSALAGIVLHANAPGDVLSGTVIQGNTLSANHWLVPFGPPQTTAIAVQAEDGPPGAVPLVTGTSITGNTMTNQFYGIWSKGQVTGTAIGSNSITTTPGGLAVFNKPDAFSGYTMVAGDGGAFTFGGARYFGSVPGNHIPRTAPLVGIAPTRDNGGYWMAGSDGSVDNFGDASSLGSLTAMHVKTTAPVVGIAASQADNDPEAPPGSPNANGYYLVSGAGGVFNFGDAKFFGSMGGKHLVKPIVGMAVTPDSLGYWLVASDGGVFSFGDAKFFGSMGGKHLNAPIVGMAADPTGGGYDLVAADGGVFTFGDAKFAGSAGALHLAKPVVGMAMGPSAGAPGSPAGGYWLVASDGGVFSYGTARFHGSTGNLHLVSPVVGFAATL
ncbi:MAG TPA: right-handed parallel beta-helix repeat-containing protein [Acidimicrobiales bacterium]|nr:right-handed parallel beta-helix repeat-containing protein [Acidimicrobiales bacterium]